MTRPAFHITILADDDATEIDCRVYAEPAEPSVGILSPQFEIEPVEPGRTLTASEEARALWAAGEWRP